MKRASVARNGHHLRNQVVCHLVVHVSPEEQNTILGKARVDIHLSLTHGNLR